MAKEQRKKTDAARRAKLTIQRRSLCLMILLGVVTFAALFTQLYTLMIRQHEELQERASKQQTKSTTISASRGTIYDRNGEILAISATADTVFLDPMVIDQRAKDLDKAREKKIAKGLKEGEKLPPTGQEYKDAIAKNLAEILEMDEETIYKRLEKTSSQYEMLRKRVDKNIGDKIRSFIKDNDLGITITGIHLSSDSKRYYLHNSLAAHVLGFVNSENHGAYGLEAIYDDALEGSDGLTVTAKDGLSRELLFQYEQYYDAKDGHSLQLTLDSNIQYFLERGLADMVSRYGAKYGASGVVLDPRSGAVLAIASNPTYDPNNAQAVYDEGFQQQLAEADGVQPEGSAPSGETGEGEQTGETGGETEPVHTEAYLELLGQLQQKQWRSKAINDTYEPGSTFKVLTLSMALEEGAITTASTFDCSGSVRVGGWPKPIYCSKKAGHGHQSLKEATANSCNPAFIRIGLSVGAQTFREYMDAFGLTEPTGIELNGEATGIAASAKVLGSAEVNLASYAFGQTFNVTPIALISAQAACINGGYLYQPYIVEKELDGDGNVVYKHDATPVRQVISEETSATVRDILEYVVSDGTGRNGQVAGYRVGGKTGTADKTGIKDENGYNEVVVSFLCFAPADDPQVIMLLTLDTPSRFTGTYVSGGNMVAPTASSIMSDILPYLGVVPQYTGDQMTAAEATVPYVVGLSEAEAAEKLAQYGFDSYRVVGDGDTVTDQTPLGGAIVPVSAEIILYMGAEKSQELCTVPNVLGLSAAKANTALTNAGLILKTTGATGEGSGIKAINQSLAEGTQVPAGTVVTVQMGQSGSTAD